MTKSSVFFLLSVSLTFGTGCATAPDVAPLPSWCQKAGLSQGVNQLTYYGRSEGASTSSDALTLATGHALGQITSELGVTVESTSEASQSESEGALQTTVRATVKMASKSVEVRGLLRADHAIQASDRGMIGCVAVQIDAAEKERLTILARNRSILTMRCKTQSLGVGACPSAVVNSLQSALSRRGANLLPTIDAEAADEAFMKRAYEKRVASVIDVVIESSEVDVINGEHYAEATVSLRHLDAGDQRSLFSHTTKPVKGGHFSTREAELQAIADAVVTLETSLKDYAF